MAVSQLAESFILISYGVGLASVTKSDRTAMLARSNDDRPPVIVLGSGVTALGVVRILARGGLNPIVAEPSDPLLRRSRWFQRFEDPIPSFDGRSLADWLVQLPVERAVLLPCSDHRVSQVASLPPDLRDRFPASVADPCTLARFVDKALFAETLASHDVPRPFTKRLDSGRDLEDVPDGVFSNAMLKPCDSQSFFAHFEAKALHVASRRDAAEQLSRVRAAGFEVVLQEYIPGPASEHFFVDGFVDRDGNVRARFARQRLRMFPTDFGNSTAMVSVAAADVAPAVDSIASLLSGAGYRGIFSAEFKHDQRDGQFKLLEVNTRAWWYIDFAARCGVDVCRMAYDDALGRPVAPVDDYRVGEHLVYPYHDYFAYRELQREGALSTWSWIRSSIGAMQPVFQFADPMPGLVAGAQTLAGFGWHRLAHVKPAAERQPALGSR